MGTVTKIRTQSDTTTLGHAVTAFLATIDNGRQRGTHRVYQGVLSIVRRHYGDETPVEDITPEEFAAWFTTQWGHRSESRWNVALDAIRSAEGYWEELGWITLRPSRMLRRRKPREDRARALSREEVERLLGRHDIGLREKTLWRMLYETAGRSAEVLRLNVEDLDMPNRSAKVTRKGGAQDTIFWESGTARLLPRYLKGRKSGPLFLTDRKARSDLRLHPADIDPASGKARLSYQQAEQIFKEASSGATLHQLRHSALTHLAEDGTNTPMLKRISGHTSIRSLDRYARPSDEAVRRFRAEHDHATRR